ncbi:hypothetical protein DFH09DRAFT_1305986 [Mycena vulgaris]|nr:hypothetical protein DFH09DRAFT_1305986 [Mycena vulgaris]
MAEALEALASKLWPSPTASRGWIIASNPNQQMVQNPNTLRLPGKLSVVIAGEHLGNGHTGAPAYRL